MNYLSRGWHLIILIVLFYHFTGAQTTVIINEVMSSNSSVLSDEDGMYEDWIELYNFGDEPVNLQGYGLSDQRSNLLKWVFPEFVIGAGEYVLIWASGKDRKSVQDQRITGIKRRFYPGIPGSSVDDLWNSPTFPNSPASKMLLNNFFEAPLNVGDHYGQHLFTYIKAPMSGEYRFWIAGDDNCRLFLSPDEDPSNEQQIAEVPEWTNPRQWTKFPQQRSDLIFLEEGSYYYMSAYMKEGGGNDHVAVRWQLPDGSFQGPIPIEHCFVDPPNMHTNFRISATGEALYLSSPIGMVIDSMPAVSIPTNFTYGRTLSDLEGWYYLENPTPEDVNIFAGFEAISSVPVFSPAGGIYTDSVWVTLSAEGQRIYYTLDGSDPDQINGTIYVGPILVTGTQRIRARTIDENKLSCEIVAATYSVVNESLIDFSSDLPLLVIQQFETLVSAGDRTGCYITLLDGESSGRISLTSVPELQSRADINIRGSSSQMFPKKGFGFHLLEENGANRKEEMLGMPEEHNWILHGPYSDKSLMRNVVSYEMAADMGHYAPRTRFVELFMHSGDDPMHSGHYHGVYVLVERIKIAPGRLELESLELNHNDGEEVTGGYIFKKDRLGEGESGFRTPRGTLLGHVRPDEQSITPAQRDYLISYVDSLEKALFSTFFKDPEIGYSAFMDVNSFIDYHLITEVCKEIDGYRLSTFLYKDRNGKVVIGPVWDYNLALGNANYLNGWDPEGWYYPLISSSEYLNGWYTRLFQDEAFVEKYKRRYRQLRQGVFSNHQLVGKIRGYEALLSESQARNFQRWNVLGSYVWPNWFIGQTYEEEIDFMVDWLERRLEWMDGQLGGAYDLVHYWNFNDGTGPFHPSYTVGGGRLDFNFNPPTEVLTGTGQDFSGENARFGDEAGGHLRVNNPIGAEVLFSLPSNGFQNLIFSYETRRSNSGANLQFLFYTVDGEQYIALDTIVVTDAPVLYSYDLSTIEDVNNNSSFSIKIAIDYSESHPGGTVGNNRFDNVTLDGEVLDGVNLPPIQVESLPDPIVIIQGEEFEIELEDYFTDPDDDSLTYEVSISNGALLSGDIVGSQFLLSGHMQGGAIIELSVSDGINQPLVASGRVLVLPRAFSMAINDFIFDHWDANEPAGAFPENMIFLQSNLNDPELEDALLFPYDIPENDYATGDQSNLGFPYRNQSRTRLNGLGAEGISFINTGRERDLGSAIVALNTTGVETVSMDWVASTLTANSRVYAIRPQYRIGQDGIWTDFLSEEGMPIEYQRSSIENEKTFFNDIALPLEALDQEYLQVAFKYYFTGERISEESGARDRLGLHYIQFKSNISSTVGQEIGDNDLALYPNPSKGTLFFNKATSGWIYSVDGRILKQCDQIRELDISDLSNGFYMYKSKEGQVLKFVKY